MWSDILLHDYVVYVDGRVTNFNILKSRLDGAFVGRLLLSWLVESYYLSFDGSSIWKEYSCFGGTNYKMIHVSNVCKLISHLQIDISTIVYHIASE